MSDEDFIIFVMNQLVKNGHNHIEDLEALNTHPQYSQIDIMQLLKRADKRIAYYIKKQDKKEYKPVIWINYSQQPS